MFPLQDNCFRGAQRLVRCALAVLTLAFGLSISVRADAAGSESQVRKFDFGDGPVADGFTRVDAATRFDSDRGYGIDLASKVEPVRRNHRGALRGDFLTGPNPFFFSVALPEGNYKVTVIFGDAAGGSTNTVKAESRRLMLERVVTAPGEFSTNQFTVNIRTPRISEGRSVRLKPREIGILDWDNKLTLEFNGARPAVCGVEIEPAPDVTTVFILGDSTVTDQPLEPWNSWGQMLTRFFKPDVSVANHAASGATIKSSLARHRVEKVFSQLRPGDYVFAQFGHNDMKDRATNALATYQANLKQLVADVRARRATPVLVTSMERKAGVKAPTLEGYPDAVREVAREDQVALIDLNKMSLKFYKALGDDLNKAFQDGTHHKAYGSYELARCVVQGIRDSGLPLAKSLDPSVPAFDPSHPDPVATFDIPASPMSSEEKPEGN